MKHFRIIFLTLAFSSSVMANSTGQEPRSLGSSFQGAVIHGPAVEGATYSTGSGMQYPVHFKDGTPVQYIHNPTVREPAATEPAPSGPIPYNSMDYWPRPIQ